MEHKSSNLENFLPSLMNLSDVLDLDFTDSSNLLGISTLIIALICLIIGICIVYYILCPCRGKDSYFLSRSTIMDQSAISPPSTVYSFFDAVSSFSSRIGRRSRALKPRQKHRYDRSYWRKKSDKDHSQVPKIVAEKIDKNKEVEVEKKKENTLEKDQEKDKDLQSSSKATGISFLWSPSKG